jgi:hypothetical protein
VKHDGGVKKLKTKASSLEAAKKIIMNAEGCPEGALELVSEMKKTYGQEGKAAKSKYNKHLRPDGKKLANASTRKAGKEISKNAEKDIDENYIREMIKSALEENLIKESINIGDTVMNNNNQFYKVISEPFIAIDNGVEQYARDNDGARLPNHIDYSSTYTAIKIKNLETGNESKANITYFKKINPEDIEGLKQAKLAQDAADKIKQDKDNAERDARWAKEKVDREEAKKTRDLSKGNIELANAVINEISNGYFEVTDYNISHDNIILYLDVSLGDEEKLYDVKLNIEVEQTSSGYYDPGDRDTPGDSEAPTYEYTLDRAYITNGEKLEYEGKVEFLPVFDSTIDSYIHKNLEEKVDEEYTDWARSY